MTPDFSLSGGVALVTGAGSGIGRAIALGLADALVHLRDQHRINRRQAAAAILDLDSRSTRFIGASLLEAVALSVGASHTPGGLQIAA